jgi:hypothetical protein
MYNSTAKFREALLIDLETGVVLQSPPNPTVSRRYIESHPFAEIIPGFVLVGPDAAKVASGAGGQEYLVYRIADEVAGSFRLVREA